MAKVTTVRAADFSAIAVATGAFGAHALKARLAPDLLAIWDTGSRYHLAHALGLLAVAWAASRFPPARP